MSFTIADRVTVAKLLGIIGSQHDAEALSAARKAHQLVQARGATWPELLQTLDQDEPAPGHAAIAQDLLHRGRGIVTKWEQNFLVGIMGFKTLVPKQQASLEAIKLKIDAASDIS